MKRAHAHPVNVACCWWCGIPPRFVFIVLQYPGSLITAQSIGISLFEQTPLGQPKIVNMSIATAFLLCCVSLMCVLQHGDAALAILTRVVHAGTLPKNTPTVDTVQKTKKRLLSSYPACGAYCGIVMYSLRYTQRIDLDARLSFVTMRSVVPGIQLGHVHLYGNIE